MNNKCPFCGPEMYTRHESHGDHYVADCCEWGAMLADGVSEDEVRERQQWQADFEDEAEKWRIVHDGWLKSNQKCGCGKPISLEDAYHYGACIECLQGEPIPF